MIPAITTLSQAGPVVGTIAVTLIALIVLIKSWPSIRQVELVADQSLRGDLLGRITALEAEIIAVRKAMDHERTRHEAEIRTMTERHSAEIRIMRHQLNNETASLDMLLAMLETAPNKVTESIGRIKEMRAQRRLEIAAEIGALVTPQETKK